MAVHLLSPNPQERGQLLESVTAELLRWKGYQEIRTREIRGGEEVDVIASFPQPIPGGTIRRIPVICECKALSSAVDITLWNIFKGKLFSARSEDADTIGILISLQGVTANVRENFIKLKKTPEGGSVHLLDEEDVLASLVGLGLACDPHMVRRRIEALCPHRLARLAIGILPSGSGLFKCFWVQNLFDDNGNEAYATVLQGDCSPAGPRVLTAIRGCGAVPKSVEIIPTEDLRVTGVTKLENDRKRLRELVSRGDSQYVHLLPESASVSAISEILVSFANTNDGKLIFGVSSGIVKGVRRPDKTKQRVSTAASFPYCRPDLRVAEPTVIELDGAPLLVFNVEKQNLMRCTGDGRCLLRQNGTVTPNFALFEESSFESQALQVRFGPVPSYLELLDEKRIASFRENLSQHKPGLADLNERDLLARFGCIVETGEGFVPSIAGLLIFGKDPGKYLPSYGIRAVRFKGTDIAGNSELYIDRLELDQPIPVAIDMLMGFIKRNIRAGAELKDVDRADVFEYPSVALREAVVNCLVHLDYSLRQKASIYIYDDRIEFTTPGGLPRGASIEKMRSKLAQHWPRNPRICEVMQYVEKSFENLGSGIRRMAKAMADAGLPEPQFADDGIQFKVTLLGQGSGSRELLETTLQCVEPPQIEIVGKSASLRNVLEQVERVAPTDSCVLIQGETGTGKELVARAIHNLSSRRHAPFVTLNCAALPSALLESELFGHERGAFVGAVAQRFGCFELADHGTLFLDEIGAMPLELQPKLLRVLEEQAFARLGSTRTIRVSVRVLVATNQSLPQMVRDAHFRADLYYRLNVFPIEVPPLRERREDIPLLVDHFVSKFSQEMGKKIKEISKEAMQVLTNASWPGNVRELQNFITRCIILTPGEELVVPDELMRSLPGTAPVPTGDDAERQMIIKALKASSGRIAGSDGAAERLGMKRTTLQDKIRRLKISSADYSP